MGVTSVAGAFIDINFGAVCLALEFANAGTVQVRVGLSEHTYLARGLRVRHVTTLPSLPAP